MTQILEHDDGILIGVVSKQLTCDVCGQEGVGVEIAEVKLINEKHIMPDATILGTKIAPNDLIHDIGITCGCYAKFHRQVAHIEDAMKARDKK